MIKEIKQYLENIKDTDNLIEEINLIKKTLHEVSPFKNEPVDCVLWVKNGGVVANDYNPNKVAPPEMQLLEVSILEDGYTQPIVTWINEDKNEVIDGFHRSRVGKESEIVKNRVNGYLPIVTINESHSDKNSRIASTIRHNRARGKHQINAMSEIVLELKNRNWKNERIARELGMDEDEILRLCQITGLQEIFKDDDFSKSWEASDSINDYVPLTDDLTDEQIEDYRTVNTSDPDRIFHTFEKWECHKAGFYASGKDGFTAEQCENIFANHLKNLKEFEKGLKGITKDWVNSCEHYLTNKSMNRIAWLGQASVCYLTGVPSKFSAGWNLLSVEEQDLANELALKYLNKWMKENNREELTMDEALSIGRQVNIY